VYYFGKQSLNSLAKKKYDEFSDLYRKAQEAKILAEEKIKEIDRKLIQVEMEIFDLRETMDRDSILESEKILREAKETAFFLQQEGEKIAKAEFINAKENLQNEVLIMIRKAVEQKLTNSLTQDQKIRLVKNQISRLRH
jgi:hypothetical protein